MLSLFVILKNDNGVCMERMNNLPERAGRKRIVVIGGGFGGLKIAGKLCSRCFDVILLDKNNYHQFQPLFYQVAIAGLEPSSIAYPYRKNFWKRKNVHFRMCTATRVIPEEKIVETDIGTVDYDYLVIAVGCDTNFFGNPELKKTTITLKSVSEALYARNRILQSFEQASSTTDLQELDRLLKFVVVGGGATGVELAGALADMRNFVLPKDYPEIDFSRMQIHLVDASPRLLAAMSEQASARAAQMLESRGVIIHQDVFVKSFENGVVTVSNGETFITDNVLWVAGITGNRIEGFQPEVYVRGNRMKVNEFGLVKGCDHVFAIGDIAYMETSDYPMGHPQVAQVAIQMAEHLVKNLDAICEGKDLRPFKYKDKGSLATVGRNAAVADLHSLKFGGAVAWWLWLIIHIFSIVGVKNKILVFLDWAWNYVTYDVSLRLLIRPWKMLSRDD